MRIVLASVPQLLMFASFLRMIFLATVVCLGVSNVVFVISHEWLLDRLADESMQLVYQAIQPSVLAENLVFSDGRCCLMSFLWISPDVTDSVEWSRHKESFPPPQRMVSVWQCTCHRRTGNSLYVGMSWLVICIDVEQQRGKDAALWKEIILSGC